MSNILNMKHFGYFVTTPTLAGLFLLVIFSSLLLPSHGHLASIFDDGNVPDGYIFLLHPKLVSGEAKPPFLNHNRVSRGPPQSREKLSASGETRLTFLKPPSFTHKYLPNQRMSKFYQNSPAIISSSTQLGHIGSRFSKPGVFNSLPGVQDPEGDITLSKEEPTFTPYIGARALSNMDKFFEHLRENLEALQKDESAGGDFREIGQPERRGESAGIEDNYDYEFTGNNASKEKPRPNFGFLRSPSGDWKPMASGDLGQKKVRSFFPLTRPTESRRMGTNFGIGKRRR